MKPIVSTRELAARTLADVVAGASLREALGPARAQVADPRDRALLMALCSEGARWWLRFDAALDHLLDKPLRQRQPALHALLILGIVQTEIMGVPQHAAVAATVEASKRMAGGRFSGLANAVLRRWLREREPLTAQLDRDPVARTAHPRWLIDALYRDWPDCCETILAANNATSPPMLRVNVRRGSREDISAAFTATGNRAATHPWLRDALTLESHVDIARLPEFAQGRFSVQDGAAQCAADLLDLRDGLRVLDACAAPGGKACHMLERANVEVLALERDAARADSIRANLQRLGLRCDLRIGDAGDPAGWSDGLSFDRILLDAPCSATGVIRRHPDIKLHRRAADIAIMATEQQRLLAALWPLLALGGRLVFATCSVLREENEAVVAGFLSGHPDAHRNSFKLPFGHAAGSGWQILPGEGGLDGMYYASLDKRG